jgi:hypothetical protein
MKIQDVRIAGGLAALCLVLAAAGLPAGAEEPRLYTNADLAALPKLDLPERSAAPRSVAPAAPAASSGASAPTGLAYEPPRLESRAAVTPARAEAIFFAGRDVDRAREVLDELYRKLDAVEDPFLPRPLLSAEEQRAGLHLDNVHRARIVEAQIADATRDLVAAETLLARVRGDF